MINIRLTPKQTCHLTNFLKDTMASLEDKINKSAWPERDRHKAAAEVVSSIAGAIERAVEERIAEIKRGED